LNITDKKRKRVEEQEMEWNREKKGEKEELELEASNQEIREVMKAVMAGLPDQEREVLLLKQYHNLKSKEIAEILRIKEAHVNTLLYRANRRMKKQLRREGYL